MELPLGNCGGFDVQAELHPGFISDACVAEVPGRPLGPVQDFHEEALATLFYIVGCSITNLSSQSPDKQSRRMLSSTLPLF